MLTDQEKLAKIHAICCHPMTYHKSGIEIATAVMKAIGFFSDGNSDPDAPIPYELAHDAVYEEIEDVNRG